MIDEIMLEFGSPGIVSIILMAVLLLTRMEPRKIRLAHELANRMPSASIVRLPYNDGFTDR
jgi:hypothetical protein